jgi:uncharacterized repeat protein (TIGR01451 family)
MTVTKSSVTTSLSAPQSVTYDYLVSNTGNTTLTGISLVDDNAGAVTCPATSLGVGASMTCHATHNFTQTELDANGSPTAGSGKLHNNVTAHSNQTSDAHASLDIPIVRTPGMTVTKSSVTTSLSAPQSVTYAYLVANTGNVTLTGISLADDNAGAVTCPATTLNVGTSMTCHATHNFTQAELDANGSPTAGSGKLHNNVTAHSNQTADAHASLDIPIVRTPGMTLKKGSTTTQITAVNQVVPYSYLVTNTGNVTLHNVTVTDDKVTTVSCPSPTLAVGASETCTGSHTVTQAEMDAGGNLTNHATAHSTEAPNATDQLSIPIIQTASLQLTKTASPSTYFAVGNVITYTYVLKNTGNVTLKAPFAVTDNKTIVTCPATPTSIAPGATITCTATYTIKATDLNATNTGSVTNTATATAKDPNNNTVTSNPAQATVRQIALTAQITPTGTTCTNFTTGTAQNLESLGYGVQRNAINSVSPGVLFYYTSIKAPAASFSITVTETNNLGWKDMGVQQGQAILYDANCVKSSSQGKTSTNSGVTTIQVTNATVGASYVVGIKYSPNDLTGQKVTSPFPTATYNWITALPGNGGTIPQSTDSVTVSPR